jgi:hypothetical protein
LAVQDGRRTPRHTALAGLLAGTLTYTWPRHSSSVPEDEASFAAPEAWEGLMVGDST